MNAVINNGVSFVVPAMSFDVKTTNAQGKKVNKIGPDGKVLTVEKIIPKERPRFGRAKSGKTHTFTPQGTADFEAWIRRHFFQAYPSGGGVYWDGRGWPVNDYFLGCQWYGENCPCTRFKGVKDFLDCQNCTFRRKNLSLTMEVHLKDERHLDLDNMIKIVLDALNRVIFYDDTQFITKTVSLVPYSAEGEHIKIDIQAVPTQFVSGSIVGGYAIKRMVVDKARAYIKYLWKNISQATTPNQATAELAAYVRRCDGRKYVDDIEQWITEN